MTKQIKTTGKDLAWNYLGYSLSLGINMILLPVVLHFFAIRRVGTLVCFPKYRDICLSVRLRLYSANGTTNYL